MPDPHNVDQLVSQLHDLSSEKPDDQFGAAISLGEIGADPPIRTKVVAELVKALSSKHQALTRAHAAEALGKLGEATAIPALITALQDNYQLTRSYAARALGKMSTAAAIAAIQPLTVTLEDKFFGARAEAAEALGKLCLLCREGDADAQRAKKIAEAALKHFRDVEKDRLARKEEEGRSRRVLNEMDLSLRQLGVLLDEIQQALEERRFKDAQLLLGRVKVHYQRMGELLVS